MFNLSNIVRHLLNRVENGRGSEENARKIRQSVENQKLRPNPHSLLFLVAVALLLAAVFAFIAANWDGINRIVRLALISVIIIVTLAVSGIASSRQRSLIAEIAAFLAACAFGGAIILFAQMYQLNGDWSSAVFFWLVGTALIAVVLSSSSALSLTFAILLFWVLIRAIDDNIFFTLVESTNRLNLLIKIALTVFSGYYFALVKESINLWFLPIWLALTAFGYHQRWIVVLKLAIIALCLWLALTASFVASQRVFSDYPDLQSEVLIGVAMFGGMLMAISWVADRGCGEKNARIIAVSSATLYGGWVLIVVSLCLLLLLPAKWWLFFRLFYFFYPGDNTNELGRMTITIWSNSIFVAFVFSLFAAFYAKSPKKLPLRYGLTLPILIMATPLITVLLMSTTVLSFSQQLMAITNYIITWWARWGLYLNVIAVFVWGIIYGNHQNNKAFVVLALIGLLSSILIIYLGFYSDLLDASLLLLLAGLITVVFGVISYWRLNRKFKKDAI